MKRHPGSSQYECPRVVEKMISLISAIVQGKTLSRSVYDAPEPMGYILGALAMLGANLKFLRAHGPQKK